MSSADRKLIRGWEWENGWFVSCLNGRNEEPNRFAGGLLESSLSVHAVTLSLSLCTLTGPLLTSAALYINRIL